MLHSVDAKTFVDQIISKHYLLLIRQKQIHVIKAGY